jgi:hypothetical protein
MRPERLLNTVAFMGSDWRVPGRITGIQSTFASPDRAFLVDIRDSDRLVDGVAARIAGSTVRLGGHRALIALSARVQPQLLYYFNSKFMPDHVAWHAERLRRG